MSKTINIEMISDFACPWCYVGKHRLQKAIALRPELEVALHWRPYQLNPDMPREGHNRRAYYLQKFGEQGYRDLRKTLEQAGAEEGIEFCDSPDAVAPNTLSAHTLMLWAVEDGNTDVNILAEKLFNAHHVACENIGDPKVLLGIAREVDMNAETVDDKLGAGADEDRVKAQIALSGERGVSGVPFFIIDERYSVSGAQPAESLASIFDQVANGSLEPGN